MDYKKSKAPVNTVTRNIMDLAKDTGNIYESVAIIAKRANQISAQIKDDLSKKLAEFASYNDSLEEVFENREQIEISRYYEKLPKPSLQVPTEQPSADTRFPVLQHWQKWKNFLTEIWQEMQRKWALTSWNS